jgi:transposase
VKKPDRYDPEINPTYAELARHYGVAVIPARVRRPKDKAKVEQGVLLAERWIIAALRHRTFYSLAEVQDAVQPLVAKLNDRRMQQLKKSRRQLFDELERTALRPLPKRAYEFAVWARPRVHIDYHIEFEEHFYSVPYQLQGQQLDVRGTELMVEIFRGLSRLTSHVRSTRRGGYTTKTEHMPKAHQAYVEWTPTRLVDWAKQTGPNTAGVVEKILQTKIHPQQGFKACLGIMSLGRRYEGRLERACGRALRFKACSYKSVESILRNKLDLQEPEEKPGQQGTLPLHGNIRGSGYYN